MVKNGRCGRVETGKRERGEEENILLFCHRKMNLRERVSNSSNMPRAWLPGNRFKPIFRGFPLLSQCGRAILISHYRADTAEISCCCRLLILGGTQTSLWFGLPTEGLEFTRGGIICGFGVVLRSVRLREFDLNGLFPTTQLHFPIGTKFGRV